MTVDRPSMSANAAYSTTQYSSSAMAPHGDVHENFRPDTRFPVSTPYGPCSTSCLGQRDLLRRARLTLRLRYFWQLRCFTCLSDNTTRFTHVDIQGDHMRFINHFYHPNHFRFISTNLWFSSLDSHLTVHRLQSKYHSTHSNGCETISWRRYSSTLFYRKMFYEIDFLLKNHNLWKFKQNKNLTSHNLLSFKIIF